MFRHDIIDILVYDYYIIDRVQKVRKRNKKNREHYFKDGSPFSLDLIPYESTK